jgi:tRNA threonylcarbamoyladenosine biosynthesis protein TsaB
MKILAIETSCEHASVALLIDDQVIELRLEGHTNHSEKLLPTLRGLLAQAQVSLTDLDAIAFGSGPGAFTGLRLACGVAQGLAMGAGLGVVPVCSLEALALQAPDGLVFIATDARMGEVYSSAYEVRDGAIEVLQNPTCTPPQHLSLPNDGDWIGMGSGLRAYESLIPRELQARLSQQHPDAIPRAGEIARIAAQRLSVGAILAPELAAPLYVRDKVALTTAERLARGGRA